MAAHWSNESVTIFTAVEKFRNIKEGAIKHTSFAVISDEMSHDKSTIYTFDSAIIESDNSYESSLLE